MAIDYEVQRSNRKKTVLIRVTAAGSVRVLAPKRLSNRAIGEIVRAKTGWIEKRLAEHSAAADRSEGRGFNDGERILFQGREIQIQHVLRERDPRLWRDRIRLDGKREVLRIVLPRSLADATPDAANAAKRRTQRGGDAADPAALARRRAALAQERAEVWLRWEAERVFAERAAAFAPQLDVRPGRITVKRLRSKWGSCSSLGNLNFNFRLIQAPPEALDYVVVHELCHLVHADHSPRFWALVESILPAYKTWKRWLRDHSRDLLVD